MLDVKHDSLETDLIDLFIYLDWFYLLFMFLLYIYANALATLCYTVMLIKLIWIERLENTLFYLFTY